MTDPPRQLSEEGVALWLDDMSRQRLTSGNLKALVRGGLRRPRRSRRLLTPAIASARW